MRQKTTKRYLTQAILAVVAWLCPFLALAQGWPANYGGVMLQGFYWDSYTDTKWTNLTSQADELSKYFDIIWVPNSGTPGGGASEKSMGYSPCFWLTHNSCFGTETELKTMISTFKAKGTTIMMDLVVNHKSGQYNWCDFPTENKNGYYIKWNNAKMAEICNTDECNRNGYKTSGAADTGEDFDGSRDLDHTSSTTQNNIKTYMDYLVKEIGYGGFRFDMVKGYSASYAGTYARHAAQKFNVGEYWDGDYNKVVNWINGTGKSCAAFDYPLKYRINTAYETGNWSALSDKGIAGDPNMSQWAVTFVDNHDTFQTGNSSRLNNQSNWLAANALILGMPGTPCILLSHWKLYKDELKKMIDARKAAGVTNTSKMVQQGEQGGGYIIVTQGTKGRIMVVCGYIADLDDSGWTPVSVGNSTNQNYAFYINNETGFNPGTDPGTGTTTTEVPSIAKWQEGKTFAYFEAPSSWSDVRAWAWNESGNLTGDEWPGTGTMTKVGSNNGNNVWLWTAESSVQPTGLLFNANGGADQTGDYTFTNGGYFTQSGLVGTVTKTGDDPTPSPTGKVKVYVKASTAPYLYAWDDNGTALNGEWPGTQMSATETISGTTYYVAELNASPANIIFNNGNGGQTDDITGVTGTVYYSYDGNTGFEKLSTPGGGDTPTPSGKVKVYVKASAAPYLYAWDDNGTALNGEWPGTQMSATETISGTTYYVAELNASPANIIFNNGNGGQTADITGVSGNVYYSYDGNTGYEQLSAPGGDDPTPSGDLPSCATVVEGKTYCYFESAWDAANVWAWTEFDNFNGTWPGTSMTKVGTNNGKNVYQWIYDGTFEFLPEMVLFNNGTDQTENMEFKNGGYYSESGLVGIVGGGTTPEEPTDKIIKIYVKSAAGANIYAWTGSGDAFRELTAKWPGDALAQTTTVGGATWYVKEFNAESVNVVLNSGVDAAQSQNFEGITADTYIEYDLATGDARITDGSTPETPTGKLTIYVKSSDPATNIYAWDDNGELTAAWPGDLLTDTKTINGESWYFKTFDKASVNVVLNNNGGNTQSADFLDLTADTYMVYNPATGETTIAGGDVEPDPVEDGDITVYVNSAANIYAWAGEGTAFAELTATWPGDALTETKVVDGKTWYCRTFSKSPINIVLNSGEGAAQSQDFKGISKDIFINYDMTTGEAVDVTDQVNPGGSGESKIPDCAVYVDGKTFAYFEASNGWTAANVWAWTEFDNFNGTWPGTPMTKVGKAANGNDVYQWIYDGSLEFLPEMILFNDGKTEAAAQTDNFTFTNGGYYTASGLLGVVEKKAASNFDINGDGNVNAGDVSALYEAILTGNSDAKFDLNGDNNVNAGDVSALYEAILSGK